MEIDKALERALRIFLCDFLVEKSNSLSIKIYHSQDEKKDHNIFRYNHYCIGIRHIVVFRVNLPAVVRLKMITF